MEQLLVNASTPYEVRIGENLLPLIGSWTKELPNKNYQRVAIVVDSNVAPLYASTVEDSYHQAGYEVSTYIFPAGESAKCMDSVLKIITWLCENHFTRSDLMVALGGGVCGDLTGFVASIYLRGIDFMQVPTTVLASIDSSVGGKTGINIPEGKNLVGAFWQPQLVVCDTTTFKTLPEEVFIDGVAEAIKTGCIWDIRLFLELSTPEWRKEHIQTIVRQCVDIKAEVVAQDELEHGLRQILNFGHTLGHAIEKLSNLTISHGHAVGIGMCLVAKAGETCGITKQGTAKRIAKSLEAYQLPTTTTFTAKELASACTGDKKRRGDTISFITLTDIGEYAVTPIEIQNLETFIEGGL